MECRSCREECRSHRRALTGQAPLGRAPKTSAASTACQLRVRGLLALRLRGVARFLARSAVVGPAVRRLGTDVDVHESGARIDADAHAARVERRDELVQLFVGNAGDADVRSGAVEVERRGALLVAETGDQLDALAEAIPDAREHFVETRTDRFFHVGALAAP